MSNIILSAHLDDEVLGCYSILPTIDKVVYFKSDYRVANLDTVERALKIKWPEMRFEYLLWGHDFGIESVSEEDTLYLPSRYDYHPLHRKVRQIGLTLPGKKMWYSTSMNVPWLEEEEDPFGKRALFERLYPGEVETISKNDKFFLFKSIKPFDDIIWCVIRFEREGFHCWPNAPEEVKFLRSLHRHKFYFEIRVQQFGDDRDLEFFILSSKVQEWYDSQTLPNHTSCEMKAFAIKRWLETEYVDRLVEVSVFEDNENGSIVV